MKESGFSRRNLVKAAIAFRIQRDEFPPFASVSAEFGTVLQCVRETASVLSNMSAKRLPPR